MILTLLAAVLIIALMIGFNALYVAGEFSSVSARRARIRRWADEGNSLARLLLPVLQDPHKLDNYIAASQVGITLSSIILGIYGQQEIAPLLEGLFSRFPATSALLEAGPFTAGITALLVLIFLTTLQVILGELVPKSLAIQFPERVALATVLPMKWSAEIVLRPFIAILNGSGSLILRLLGADYEAGHAHVHSPEEILILVKDSHTAGMLDAEERFLLRNVFRSRETIAEEIAIPRNRLVAASIDMPLGEVLDLAAQSPYSRIPMYRGDIDNIVGFVHLRDLFNLYQAEASADVGEILRPIPFVPESVSISEVWDELNEHQSYLAVVFDEYGGTSGLITREDLIEEFFGEIQDEFDQESDLVTAAKDDELIVRGDMQVQALNDLLGVELPEGTAHTVGGMVLERLGRAPRTGDYVDIAGIRLEVEAMSGLSVRAVRVVQKPNEQSGDRAVREG